MCANWVGDNRDMSPDRNRPNRYQLDNVGLQIGLGLPLQLLGVSLMNNFNSEWRPSHSGNRGRGGPRRNQPRKNNNGKVEVQQTCDGIPIRKLYVTNISSEMNRSVMRQIFGCYGPINHIYLGVSKNDNTKQFAFITFVNPIDAARVLSQQRFQDFRGRWMFAMPADSWHQPRELPDGTVDWRIGRKPANTQEEESEEDEEATEEIIKVETEINEGSLNMLNDDCLLHIFSFMSYKEVTAVERVCKRWQALSFRMWQCLHELNFRKEGLFSKMPCNAKALDQYLKRCGASLTTLDLSSTEKLSDNTLAVVAKHCKNLEVLRVKNISVANRSLAHLGRSCPMLKQLVMDSCEKVTDNDLNTLLPKCPDLKILDLSNLELNGKCLANVQGPVTNLRLSEVPSLNYKHLITGLQKMSPTLETVTLNACPCLPRSAPTISDIVATVPNITSFAMSRCMVQFDYHSLAPIGQLKKLKSLNLYLNNAVNDQALSAIVEGCEELTSLNLCGSAGGCAGLLSERGLSMLSRLKKLTHLNLSYLEATNSVTLKNITARNCKLKSLVCRGCPELTDEGTEAVVTLCNELELFDVSGCSNVTHKTVETALTSVKMRTNNTPLKLIVGGTEAHLPAEANDVPLLTVDMRDLCEEHMRPDFIDDMFFPPSDSDDDEDLDHLCERIGCDCDFDFDDLFDPTLVDDETRKFAVDFDDVYNHQDHWIIGDSEDDNDDDDIEQWDI